VKIRLYYVGKPRDAHANAMAREYIKRHPGATMIALDPAGRAADSAELLRMIERAEREARDLVFLVGGADGLPAGWARRADLLLSLSPLTLPHELARLILAEQIYRAFTTLRGHPYPR